MSKALFISFALLLFAAITGSSQSLVLTDEGQVKVLGHMSYLRDDADSLSFTDIRTTTLYPLEVPSQSPSFGFDRATHWFRFTVLNKSNENQWLLEIPYSPLDRIDLYLEQSDSNQWLHKTDGDIFPIAHRDMKYRHPVFKLNIPVNQTRTIYVRIKTISSVQLPATFWTNASFQIASYNAQLINGLFYGAMMIMILYQLFLFFSIRDRTTLYYVLTLMAMANVISFYQGYNFLFLHPANPHLNDVFASMCGPSFVLCSALLTRSFLQVRHFSRPLDILLITNTLLNLSVGILMLFFNRQIPYKVHHLFVLSHCIIVLICAGYCLYYKYKPALYYLLAWVTPLVAASVFTMGNLGVSSIFSGTNYVGLMMGCILQVLFISLALGERWNVLVQENEAAKELELRRGQEENIRLEHEVHLRTEEIRLQKETLEELNRIKDKLFSIVSHDIKEPLTSLKLSLALVKMEKLSPEEFKDIATTLETHLDQTTDFIQNLLQWAKFQLHSETVKPTKLGIQSLLEETIALFEITLREKVITLKRDTIDASLVAYADPVMMQSVLRNLLTNAIKFSPLGGTITIHGEAFDNKLHISVSDTGAGIPEANRSRIFTLESVTTKGTKEEAGTGLGLVLCKEFVEKNNGSIRFETAQGKGTTFHIYIPQYKEEITQGALSSSVSH